MKSNRELRLLHLLISVILSRKKKRVIILELIEIHIFI